MRIGATDAATGGGPIRIMPLSRGWGTVPCRGRRSCIILYRITCFWYILPGPGRLAWSRPTEEIENVAYTRYVMDAGVQGDFLDLMAALSPCCFGYGEIGARLAGSADAHTPYRDWIETYADEDYQGVMASVGQMIDGAVMRRLGPDFATSARWPALQDRFATATRLEVAFWDMGLRGA